MNGREFSVLLRRRPVDAFPLPFLFKLSVVGAKCLPQVDVSMLTRLVRRLAAPPTPSNDFVEPNDPSSADDIEPGALASELDRPRDPNGLKLEKSAAKEPLDVGLALVSRLYKKSRRIRYTVATMATKEKMARKTAIPILAFLRETSASSCGVNRRCKSVGWKTSMSIET